MTATSAALHFAVWQTLPARLPGLSAAAIQAALLARGIDRALTSIKQVLPRMRRDGYVVSVGVAGHDDFRWYRSEKPMREPAAVFRGHPPGTAVARAVVEVDEVHPADRLPHRYPVSVLRTRLPKTPVTVRPCPHQPVAADADLVRVWAARQGLRFKGWPDLAGVNERRRALGLVEFARPALRSPEPLHPMVR
jgi:hypothetical protein